MEQAPSIALPVYSVPTLLRMAADMIDRHDPTIQVILDAASPVELYLGVLMPMPE